MKLKGIILAGGKGTRLYPATSVISKHLLPIYNKPMIFYPLSVLMSCNIKDILVISTKEQINLYKRILTPYSKIGLNFSFKIQKKPNGIAESLIIGKKFLGNNNFVLILGDNLFFGKRIDKKFKKLLEFKKTVGIVTYRVKNTNEFGILELNKNKAFRIIEKPKKTDSELAVTGIYFYKNCVLNSIQNLQPSKRGELEISDLNNTFLKKNDLNFIILEKNYSWLDTGTYLGLLNASQFVMETENMTKKKIACLEEIALKKKFSTKSKLRKIIQEYPENDYKNYLKRILYEKY